MKGTELTFRVVVSRIEWYAVLACDGGVEGRLHVIDCLRHEFEIQNFVAVQIVEKALEQQSQSFRLHEQEGGTQG